MNTPNNKDDTDKTNESFASSMNVSSMTNIARKDPSINSESDDDIANVTKSSWPHKRGNFSNKSPKRKKVKTLHNNVKEELDSMLTADKGESPLILFELSNREWELIQPNSILLDDASMKKEKGQSVLHQKVHYSNYVLGNNINKNNANITSTSLPMKDEGKMINVSIINVLRIKQSMIAIVTSKENIFKVYSKVLLMTSSRTPVLESNPFFHGSGKVLLFMYKHVNAKDENKNKWNASLFDKVKKTKPNICINNGKNNHFRSQGYIAAWGNKALYGNSSLTSTIGQYVTRKPKKEKNIEAVTQYNEELEVLMHEEIVKASSKFDKWFPNFKHLIAPVMKVAFDKQIIDGDINLKEEATAESGLWQSEICVNAMTRDFHTEKDITYTLISVPDQIHDGKNMKKPYVPIFLFQINDNVTFGFKLQNKSSFIFNGTMLTHRQFSENGYLEKNEKENINNFYNVACYGNQRLFNHMRKSFRRNLGIE